MLACLFLLETSAYSLQLIETVLDSSGNWHSRNSIILINMSLLRYKLNKIKKLNVSYNWNRKVKKNSIPRILIKNFIKFFSSIMICGWSVISTESCYLGIHLLWACRLWWNYTTLIRFCIVSRKYIYLHIYTYIKYYSAFLKALKQI